MDSDENFEYQLKRWGIASLRTKFLRDVIEHRQLLDKYIRFSNQYHDFVQKRRKIDENTETKEQQDLFAKMRRKKQIFQALKTLLQNLVLCNDQELTLKHIDRISEWLTDKLNAAESS